MEREAEYIQYKDSGKMRWATVYYDIKHNYDSLFDSFNILYEYT
jgi:hypothetical protein